MAKMGHLSGRFEVADDYSKHGCHVDDNPCGNSQEMHFFGLYKWYVEFNIQAKHGSAEVGDKGIADTGNTDGAEISKNYCFPPRTVPVFFKHCRSSQSAEDDMKGVQYVKHIIGDDRRKISQDNNDHNNDPGNCSYSGEGDMRFQFIDYVF